MAPKMACACGASPVRAHSSSSVLEGEVDFESVYVENVRTGLLDGAKLLQSLGKCFIVRCRVSVDEDITLPLLGIGRLNKCRGKMTRSPFDAFCHRTLFSS